LGFSFPVGTLKQEEVVKYCRESRAEMGAYVKLDLHHEVRPTLKEKLNSNCISIMLSSDQIYYIRKTILNLKIGEVTLESDAYSEYKDLQECESKYHEGWMEYADTFGPSGYRVGKVSFTCKTQSV